MMICEIHTGHHIGQRGYMMATIRQRISRRTAAQLVDEVTPGLHPLPADDRGNPRRLHVRTQTLSDVQIGAAGGDGHG